MCSQQGPDFPPVPLGISAQDTVNAAHVYDWYAQILKDKAAKTDDA